MEAKEERDLCEREVNDFHKTINDQQAEFDKQLLTLSSGLIVLSLAFAKDIAVTGPEYVPLLITGLCATIVCIAFVLFSYRWSIFGLEKAKLYWEGRRDKSDGNLQFPRMHAATIKWLNNFTGAIFGVGLCCIALFVILNINKEIQMAKHPANDGATVKLPQPDPSKTAGATLKNPAPPPPNPPKADK